MLHIRTPASCPPVETHEPSERTWTEKQGVVPDSVRIWSLVLRPRCELGIDVWDRNLPRAGFVNRIAGVPDGDG